MFVLLFGVINNSNNPGGQSTYSFGKSEKSVKKRMADPGQY